jgi:uncharacterized protein
MQISSPSALNPGLPPLIAALRDPVHYPHAVQRMDMLETHISWVMLTGRYAYKIKKPVNLGFLDFSTLEARRHYCEEELRLNRRLAPSLYLAVVTISGSADYPCIRDEGVAIAGDGTAIAGSDVAIEYAVKMREFPQSALASALLAEGRLTGAQIDTLAACIAAFHADTGVAAHGCSHGTPEMVIESARDNFAVLGSLLLDAADQARLTALLAWTEHEYDARHTLIEARQTQGWVRECHGDLHLGNIVMLEGKLTPFDCIEFNPGLRWIDVMSEVAFLVMDLMDRGRTDFASRFLNAYVASSGDYAGLGVLRFYRVYRAMVRAKVHGIRAAQDGITDTERARLFCASRRYVDIAQRCADDARSAIILMHGVSGSGKSVIAQALAEQTGAIHLRSDVERKRLGGIAPLARSDSTLASGIYTADATRATYTRLLDLSRLAITAGYTVVVDAAFLQRWQRDLFRRQAHTHGLSLVIVAVTAPEATLRARITARLDAGNDPSEADLAVLTQQIAKCEALGSNESPITWIDTAHDEVNASVRKVVEALGETVLCGANA